LRIENGTAFDRTAGVHENPEWLLGTAEEETPLAHGVRQVCFYRAGWCAAHGKAALPWKTSAHAHPPHAGLIGIAPLGDGRVVVVTDSMLFGDERIEEFDHRQLWLNLVYWLAAPTMHSRHEGSRQPVLENLRPDPETSVHWTGLKNAITRLRLLQESDGRIAPGDHSPATSSVEETLASLAGLQSFFPHQAEYFTALPIDFAAWQAGGFGKPDFGRSLAAFHPEKDRRDQRPHLVLFPLYTPNASSDIRFEALILRTPWPPWLADLERTSYPNPKFAPGHLVEFTPGYASECAVLFPETVSATGRPPNHFATIFCDREAKRLHDCTLRSAQLVRLTLFPELDFWLGDRALMEETVALWDLIHDASHSLGELPFDPFMIRQRAPFWMYGLEELRVDLRSFEEAITLAATGFPFARYVPWAILLDRIFRFPITGPRVRNYDALGGQLLFAYLHQHDVLIWRDNRLTIRWAALAEGIRGLRAELTALYKLGADWSKLTFWLAGHELVSRYVRPNVASQWKEGARVINDEHDLKRWIGLVHEDEFPLGSFHLNLQRGLARIAMLDPREDPACFR
jgi:hypothetical protein